MTQHQDPGPRPVSTVQRAMAVLDTLGNASGDLGTNEIARRSGVNPSTVSRILATLAGQGLVRRVDDTGRYRLGLRLVTLANAALARLDLRDLARPHLVALSETTGETATLSVPDGYTAVTVDFVQGPSSVQSVARLGRSSVPHATAVGKVVLAHSGGLPDGPLTAYTQHTITDRRALADEIARTAERGWGQALGEREVDLNAVAAPVVGLGGQLLGVVGVQGPASRFGRAVIRAAVPQLVARAGQIPPAVR